MKSFIKVKEASKLYGLGVSAIYKAIHEKRLKAYKPNKRDFLIKVTEFEE